MGTTMQRGSQRSDAEVFAVARKRLDDCPAVPGTVRVHVDAATVTLTGTVQRPSQRADAADAVIPVIGTRQLVNNITVLGAPRAEEFEAS